MFPTHTTFGAFCRWGTFGGWVFAVRRDFALQFWPITLETIMAGRIATLQLEAADYQLGVVGVHLVSNSAEQAPRQPERVAARVQPLGRASIIVLGDAIFKLGGFPQRAGSKSGWEVSHHVAGTCRGSSTGNSMAALGFSRRQHRGGAVSLFSRIDRVWANLRPAMLRTCSAQAPIRLAAARQEVADSACRPAAPVAGGIARYPQWLSEHARDGQTTCWPQGGGSPVRWRQRLQVATMANRRAARIVMETASAPGPCPAVRWQAHRLTIAHRERRRRNYLAATAALASSWGLQRLFIGAQGSFRGGLSVVD